jgi:hypothetical protein
MILFMKRLFLLAFVLIPFVLSASPKYWIYLKNKDLNAAPAVSPLTLENRQKLGLALSDDLDLPIKKDYEQTLREQSVNIINRSKWLNAVSANDQRAGDEGKAAGFRSGCGHDRSRILHCRTQPIEKAQMAPVMSQVQANAFLKEGITAKDVTIGVIDAGFYGADSSLSLISDFFK